MVKARKGFTLVELLIVIVIIGILASAMLLSSSSATASAEASTIISELRNLKAATMMFYADSMDDINANKSGTASALKASTAITLLKRYMDNPEKLGGNYMFKSDTTGSRWWVGFLVSGNTDEVKEKLQGKAASTGLYGGSGTSVPEGTGSGNGYKKTNSSVWMVAR
ncbi:MAG: prepilin-type N-terminal cleavage/methylation domain-containing protein [Synergistaceae bacterium]|jgi:general secretion pathway protein G|nr:prepilin-type N-terminal cleavage/methylation domain-containing protein [Synergistaceae bacterium]